MHSCVFFSRRGLHLWSGSVHRKFLSPVLAQFQAWEHPCHMVFPNDERSMTSSLPFIATCWHEWSWLTFKDSLLRPCLLPWITSPLTLSSIKSSTFQSRHAIQAYLATFTGLNSKLPT